MLSIDVAAILSVATRLVPPDTPGIAMAVVLAGITALA
jgi:predicted MFS family arabinose efflux permease